jgi:hypothetical protein
MPPKVSIIDVDLGVSVADIIANEIRSLDDATRAKVDESIEMAKATERTKEARQKATDRATELMETAYDILEGAKEKGVAVTTILEFVKEAITTSSAFSLRMKKILSDKGNPYLLERKKVDGILSYVFAPFNKQDFEDGPSAYTEPESGH